MSIPQNRSLVIRLIRSGDELAIASELKGLTTKTSFGKTGFHFRQTDSVAIFLLLLLSASSIGLQFMLKAKTGA